MRRIAGNHQLTASNRSPSLQDVARAQWLGGLRMRGETDAGGMGVGEGFMLASCVSQCESALCHNVSCANTTGGGVRQDSGAWGVHTLGARPMVLASLSPSPIALLAAAVGAPGPRGDDPRPPLTRPDRAALPPPHPKAGERLPPLLRSPWKVRPSRRALRCWEVLRQARRQGRGAAHPGLPARLWVVWLVYVYAHTGGGGEVLSLPSFMLPRPGAALLSSDLPAVPFLGGGCCCCCLFGVGRVTLLVSRHVFTNTAPWFFLS